MRIKLILAASPEDPLLGREPFMPLSLPLLAASAPGHDYQLIDLLAGEPPRDLESPADLVGISMRATAEAAAYRLAHGFRARGIPVVLGGPQASAVPMRALEHADAVAVGEGEPLWPTMVQDAARGELRRLYVCGHRDLDPRGHTIHRVEELPDLSTLAPARRDLMPGRYRFDTVFATRGCPMGCDFCAVPEMFGRRLRKRPVDQVVAEINQLGSFYYLLDDTVFGRAGSHDYYLELYTALAALPRLRLWTGQINLDALASEKGRRVVKAAARAGLIYAAAGLESVDPDVLRLSGAAAKMGLGPGEPALDATRHRVRALQELGIIVSGWFTIGYPQDSAETYRRTFAFCEEMNILPVVTPLRALAGTPLHRRLARDGGLAPPDAVTNVAHATLGREQVVAELKRGVSRAYSPGAILARTAFYRRRWANLEGGSPELSIRRNIFALMLQWSSGRILARENENLARGHQDLIPLDNQQDTP